MDMGGQSRGRGRGRGRGGRGGSRGRGGRGGGGGGGSGGGGGNMMIDERQNRRNQRQRGRGRGRGRGGGGGGAPAVISENDTGPYTVQVSGWDQLNDPNDQLNQQINFVKAEMKGAKMAIFQVDDLGVANSLKRLNGRKMNGRSMNIRLVKTRDNEMRNGGDVSMGGGGGGGGGFGGGGPVNIIASLDTLYNKETKMLNLAGVAHSQFESWKLDLNNDRMATRLWEILRDRCGDVITINFARNYIKNLVPFQKLPDYLPNAVNLCFENNRIADLRQLDALKNIKLREVIFIDNPITGKANYKDEVVRRYPQLQFLDKQKIEPMFKFADIPAIIMPPEKPAFFDLEQNQTFALNFLKRFFATYDGPNRTEFLEVYTEASYFSLSCSVLGQDSSQQQPSGGGGGRGGRGGPKHQDASGNLAPYLPYSRNLLRVGDPAKRTQLIFKGRVDIVGTLRKLPNTKHQLEDMKVEAFVLEGHPLQLLSIHIHGSFWEYGAEVNRSFNRVLVLTPANIHTRAYQEGWQALILNDELSIHNYTPAKTPTPSSPAPVAAASMPGVSAAMMPALHYPPGLNPQQLAVVQEFVKATNLRPEYAADCLNAAAWVGAKAWQIFLDRKMQNLLPSEAWLPGPR